MALHSRNLPAQSLLPENSITPAQTTCRTDWLYFIFLLVGAGWSLLQYGEYMDDYEKIILLGGVPVLCVLGRYFKPFRWFLLVSLGLALGSIQLYQNDLTRAESNFLLKYFLSSQSALMWMCVFYAMATLAYWFGLVTRSVFANKNGTYFTWFATVAGLTGLLTRWYESYLISPEIGHIPISNLYEVFVLFCLVTSLLHLFYERRYQQRALGAFVLPIILGAVFFLLWYAFEREASTIQPLVPALQSYWMKLHVPANFIGYGAFTLAAAIAFVYLLCAYPWFQERLPDRAILEDLMYKVIAIGFTFFTIATILGAVWAAEAWGGYWSWDPKETWALIVWLNYAAWLHLRLIKGWHGAILAWWALIGLGVTLFAFLGVNLFLSGLHSYGQL